jgi:predicted lipid-binding transport protein (Tim44 family)
MSSEGSVTGWIPRVQAGDPEAVQIRPAPEVTARAAMVTDLLDGLANGERVLAPAALCASFGAIFLRVQQAWEARDYQPLADLLLPELRAEHERQLALMAKEKLFNVLKGLTIDRLELVHVDWPERSLPPEVTALITFRAASY